MTTLYKLVNEDGTSLREDGRVQYDLAGGWMEVGGNGAYCTTLGGNILAGGHGPRVLAMETDDAPDVCASGVAGVVCRQAEAVVSHPSKTLRSLRDTLRAAIARATGNDNVLNVWGGSATGLGAMLNGTTYAPITAYYGAGGADVTTYQPGQPVWVWNWTEA